MPLQPSDPPVGTEARNGHGVWPAVEGQDWCGHFAATVERFMSAAE